MQFFYVYRRIELQKDMKHMVQYAKPFPTPVHGFSPGDRAIASK